MSGRRVTQILIAAFLVAGTAAAATVLDRSAGEAKPEQVEPHDIIKLFIAAVERGELQVFGRRLDRSMIVPERVEYAYSVDSTVPLIKVYARLTPPIPAPNHKDCEIRAVSATMAVDGHNVDTEIHVWPK